MYSVVLTEKINQLESVRAWAKESNYGSASVHLASAILSLKAVRGEVIRSEEAAAIRDEQARHACKCGNGRCGT